MGIEIIRKNYLTTSKKYDIIRTERIEKYRYSVNLYILYKKKENYYV